MVVFEESTWLSVRSTELRDLLVHDLPSLAALLPAVERIEPLHADWASGSLERRDRWVGRLSSPVLQRLLPPGVVDWVIRSSWSVDPLVIRWELEPKARLFEVSGQGGVSLRAHDDRTHVTLHGVLEIGARSRLGLGAIERALGEHLQHNLRALLGTAEAAVLRRRANPGGGTGE